MKRSFWGVLLCAFLAAGISSPVAAGENMVSSQDIPVSSLLRDMYTAIGIGSGSMTEKLAFLGMVSVADFSPSSHQGFSLSRVYLPCRF